MKILFISRGGKYKILKGDMDGLFLKQGAQNKNQLSIIELKQDCAFVAVPLEMVNEFIKKLNNTRL